MMTLLKRTGSTIAVLIIAALVAWGYSRYVYPAQPLAVWGLLFFCWLCYRLRRRAIETFAPRLTTAKEATPPDGP